MHTQFLYSVVVVVYVLDQQCQEIVFATVVLVVDVFVYSSRVGGFSRCSPALPIRRTSNIVAWIVSGYILLL